MGNRLTKKSHTFSNGLHVPRGTILHVPNTRQLPDGNLYQLHTDFDGMRFYREGQRTGQPEEHKLLGSVPQNRQFGSGRHLW